jgi:hypothetical protein
MGGLIESAVQRGQERRRCAAEQRERPVDQVDVQHVELMRAAIHLLQHHHMRRKGVAQRTAEAQRARQHRLECHRGDRIAAGEQRHVVTEIDEFFCQIRNDPLGSAVELRRNCFGQRRDLGDSHDRDAPAGRRRLRGVPIRAR